MCVCLCLCLCLCVCAHVRVLAVNSRTSKTISCCLFYKESCIRKFLCQRDYLYWI